MIIKLSKEQEIEVPTEIDNARTVIEFIEELTFDKHWEHEYVDNYLKNLFNKHCNYLEKNIYECNSFGNSQSILTISTIRVNKSIDGTKLLTKNQ